MWEDKKIEHMTYNVQHLQAAGILCIHKGKVLAVNKDDKGNWVLPFGKKEPDEDLSTCAIRETFEETGLVAEILYPVYTACATVKGKHAVLIQNPYYDPVLGIHDMPLDEEPYWSTCFLANVKGKLKASSEGTPDWVNPKLLLESSPFAKYNSLLFKHVGLI